MEVDEALAAVGGYRRWHLAAFCLIGVTSLITLAGQSMNIVFTGRMSPHHCKVPEDVPLNVSLPLDDTTGELSQCSMYVNSSWSNETTSCTDGWTYNPTDGENTFVMEFDLVCEYSIYSELSQVYYQIGGILGELAASILSDRYGRRWVHASSYVMTVTCGIGIAFAPNYLTYVILRTVVAFSVGAGINAAFTHLFELFDSGRRAFVGVGAEYFWTVGYFYTALIGWLVTDWRQFQLIISLTAIAGLINACVVESPLWLLANHRTEEAEKVLQKMARYNGVSVPDRLLHEKDTDTSHPLMDVDSNGRHKVNGDVAMMKRDTHPPEETGQETLWDLFRWPLLFKYTWISTFLWFVNCVVYYFLILATPSLGGNLNRNFALGGLVEIPAFTVAGIVVSRSRRISTCVFHILAGAALVALAFIPASVGDVDLSYVIVAVALLGKFAITTSFSIIVLYTREFFPTNLRGTASGVCNILGRAGNVVAPFASYAAKSVPWVPNVLLGAISLAVALVTLMLPETKDWPLPQSIADVYRYTRGEHRSSEAAAPKKDRDCELSKLT